MVIRFTYMQFIEFKEKLKRFPVFNLSEIRKIEVNFDLRRLHEWTSKGYIKKIRRGFYIFSDMPLDEVSLFYIANKIYHPSYVSLQMAFSWYNLIPEAVYMVTSVTSQKTNTFTTSLGDFQYQHVKPEFFFGYDLKERNGQSFMVAEVEKALLDYLYLNPEIKEAEDFVELRFNCVEFKTQADLSKIKNYATMFNNQALGTRLDSFLRYLKYA